jgi:hypothetical protein
MTPWGPVLYVPLIIPLIIPLPIYSPSFAPHNDSLPTFNNQLLEGVVEKATNTMVRNMKERVKPLDGGRRKDQVTDFPLNVLVMLEHVFPGVDALLEGTEILKV